MLIEKHDHGDYTIKIFKIKNLGYNYRIYYNKKQIHMCYIYHRTIETCREDANRDFKMLSDMNKTLFDLDLIK